MNNKPHKTKLLIISAYYPPIISVASQRLHAIAKYIDKNIYEVYVFFPYSGEQVINDENVTLVPIKTKSWFGYANFNKNTSFIFHKLKALWNRILMAFDVSPYRGFEQKVLAKVSSIVDDERFVIISSSPPIEVHKVAKRIKERYRNCLLICDLRDALTNNPYIPKNKQKQHSLVEQQILQYADAITSVSMPIIQQLENNNKRQIPIVEIRNGFDFEARLKFHFNEQFTIVHAGTFYADRNPYTFFKALEKLLDNGNLQDFRIILLGQTSGINIPFKMMPYVERLAKVSYADSIKLMQIADSLLLIHPPSEYKGVYTGKLFDYLGAMRPIIALIDKNDVAADLIRECNAGFIADFNNIEEIEQAILEAYKLWKNKSTLNFNTSLIYLHHRAYQVKLLEHLIYKIANGK